MQLCFMVMAILILTLIAALAIRRAEAEDETIERREFDHRPERNGPSAQMNGGTASGTNARA
jgi:hypothetical protein